ncbi:response regulator [Rhizobium halophytocola]|uniref:Two-component system chemotaxis response regulator CheY n=1 Tax=Rhizobium halophytocola TaxID=735519 RepID=A0ABS4DSQ3_9HYPH|nr:response regulator [Rhizobium halophytocola]MBP1848721.1 two-component system chemotaxis response regulator CheY [Rhizobium halophytocola]
MQRLIIADGSDIVRKVGKRILSELNFDVLEAPSARDALRACQTELPQVMIIDAGLEGAIDLITNVRAMPEGKEVKIYYCVVEADLKTMMAGKRAGASDFLQKPFDRKILTKIFSDNPIAA